MQFFEYSSGGIHFVFLGHRVVGSAGVCWCHWSSQSAQKREDRLKMNRPSEKLMREDG